MRGRRSPSVVTQTTNQGAPLPAAMAHQQHPDAHAHEPVDHSTWLRHMRGAKDVAFRTQAWSPIPHEARHDFDGLRYYEPDERYRQTLRLQKHAEPKLLDLPTSSGASQRYANIGHFAFDVEGRPVDIQAYRKHGSDQLFIPLRDKTSGKETYGAGRYLDLDWNGEDAEYEVDLNQLYNPYCAYNEEYSCPLPPPENWLQVEIRAGEKTWKP